MRLRSANFRNGTLAIGVKPGGKHSLDCATVEEDNALQFLVVEEIVEAPQWSWLAERIRIQVWIVAVNVTIVELNFIVNCLPQWVLQLGVWNMEKKEMLQRWESLGLSSRLHCSPATAAKLESMEFAISWMDGSLLNSWLCRRNQTCMRTNKQALRRSS